MKTLTQAHTKRHNAASLAKWLAENGLSNGELGDVLGCAEGTIRNRLDADDFGKQMTVHELARGGRNWGAAFIAAVLSPLVPVVVTDPIPAKGNPLRAVRVSSEFSAEVLKADEDNIWTAAERERVVRQIDASIAELQALRALLCQPQEKRAA